MTYLNNDVIVNCPSSYTLVIGMQVEAIDEYPSSPNIPMDPLSSQLSSLPHVNKPPSLQRISSISTGK